MTNRIAADAAPSRTASLDLRAILRRPAVWALLITLLAFGLRVWQLEGVPPGWRDDELIESLVISQKILDGDLAFFYPDASGHEALYHALNALFLAWFGPTGPGIRLLSAFLGTLAVPLTYALARRMFGAAVGLAAAALLGTAFWGLMYARVGIRHSLSPVLALAAFCFFWQALEATGDRLRTSTAPGSSRVPRGSSFNLFALSGLFLGLGFHSYFASRGAPLIPAAFILYLILAAPSRLRGKWRGLLLMAAVTGLVALPLFLALAAQPEAEGRVGELALPLIQARRGDFGLVIEHAVAALTMAHATGDPEWLYNIPYRAVFGPAAAVFFWAGVALAGWRVLASLVGRLRSPRREATGTARASAFLIIWWLVGISPAVLSVPPASLGHVILAQPAFYMLAALPLQPLAEWAGRKRAGWKTTMVGLAAVVLVAGTSTRDLPDYFIEWPSRGMVRFLYHADVEDVARYILRDPAAPDPVDFSITGPLAGPWNRIALELALDGHPDIRPRWYNPERALLLRPAISFSGYPEVDSPYVAAFEPLPAGNGLRGGYALSRVSRPALTGGQAFRSEPPVCFANGLCWAAAVYDPESGILTLEWEVSHALDLPPMPLISNPPPPNVYSGPRLAVFAQLLGQDSVFLTGDDGLWVDPDTLREGDLFWQRHVLSAPVGERPASISIGLYDPMTGARIPTVDGRDHIALELD